MNFTPSKYQAAIFEWVASGHGNAYVNAVAGSGKTTTLEVAAGLIDERVGMVAFNRSIAEEMKRRMRHHAHVSVSTAHSHGLRAVRKTTPQVDVDGRKYFTIIRRIVERAANTGAIGNFSHISSLGRAACDGRQAWPLIKLAKKVLSFVRNDLSRPTAEAIHDVVLHQGLEVAPGQWDVLPLLCHEALEEGHRQARTVVDFDDMICLPLELGLQPPRYPWILVDEAQDLSKARLELMVRSLKPGGRMLAVGDRRQAIYGFAGADCGAVDTIIERTSAQEMPLSICYRCPRSHVEMAREIVPQIEAADWAEEGSMHHAYGTEEILSQVQRGELILCRTTAPLIGLCYRLIRSGMAAQVRGRDIGKGLVEAVEKLKVDNFTELPGAIEGWRAKSLQRVLSSNGGDDEDPALQSIRDRADCLINFYQHTNEATVSGLCREIQALFSDDSPSVMLSTVHRAKGLEGDRVSLLNPSLMPLGYAKRQWQVEQEWNLKYVALTRSKSELGFYLMDEVEA